MAPPLENLIKTVVLLVSTWWAPAVQWRGACPCLPRCMEAPNSFMPAMECGDVCVCVCAQEEWRSKLLKDVQYLCKLAYLGMAHQQQGAGVGSRASDAKDALPERLKYTATALSLARRVMMAGSWVEGCWDLQELLKGGGSGSLLTLKGVTVGVKLLSDVADDVRREGAVGSTCMHV